MSVILLFQMSNFLNWLFFFYFIDNILNKFYNFQMFLFSETECILKINFKSRFYLLVAM